MNHVDFLIIGGGVAGTTAAETIRLNSPSSRIMILESERYPLYSRVQIPYYLRGIKTREQIFLRTFKDYQDKNIEFKHSTTASSLNLSDSQVTTSNGETYSYGKLLITTGGTPKRLKTYPVEHYMQTVDDADALLYDVKKAKKGLVIGSGFIALEMIEVFLHYGLETSLGVNQAGFWSSFLSSEMSNTICNALKSRGVSIYYGDSPSSVGTDTIVGVGIGLDLNRQIFDESGLKFEKGLEVDAYLRAAVPNVFVAGDVAKFYSAKLDRPVRYGNWTNALVSGKYAGLNMLGNQQAFDMLSAYSITHDKLSLIFLGFTGVDTQTERRTQVISETECIEFFIRQGRLDGCILCNRSQDRQTYQKLIESRELFS